MRPSLPTSLPLGPSLVREPDGAVVAARVEVADGFLARFRGLMLRPRLEAGSALWLEPCSSIHMMFMRFRIDAVFLDSIGTVLGISPRVLPWLGFAACRGARTTVELPAGAAAAAGISPGDRLVLRGVPT